MWLAPFALYSDLGDYSIFAVGILTLFYNGLLNLAKILFDPLNNEGKSLFGCPTWRTCKDQLGKNSKSLPYSTIASYLTPSIHPPFHVHLTEYPKNEKPVLVSTNNDLRRMGFWVCVYVRNLISHMRTSTIVASLAT